MATTDKTTTVTGANNSTPILPPSGDILLAWSSTNWTGVTGALQVYSQALEAWIDVKDEAGAISMATANDCRVLPGGLQYRIRGIGGATPIILGYDKF